MSGRRARAHRKAERERDGAIHLDPRTNANLRYFLRPPWTVHDADVEFALQIVEASGVLDVIGPKLAKATGRKRQSCTLEGLLVAVAVHVSVLERDPILTEVSRTLHECISLRWRERFRSNYTTPGSRSARTHEEWLRATAQDRANAYQATRRLWKEFRLLMDSRPWPGGKRLTHEEVEDLEPLPADKAAERDELLEEVCNRFLAVSADIARDTLPLEKVLPVCAVDATFVPSNSHKASKDFAPFDLDITTYGRQATITPERPTTTASGRPRARRDSPKQRKEKYDQGWEAHVIALSPDPFSDFRDDPELALAMTFAGCGFDPTGNGLRALYAAVIAGLTPGILAFDNSYVTGPFMAKAKELGFELLFDPRADQADKITLDQGALVTNGSAFCPGCPSDLLTINDDYNLRLIDKPTRDRRVEERALYELRTKEYLKDGRLRMTCPALAPSGRDPRVLCSLRTNVHDNPKNLPVVEAPPAKPDPEGVCRCAGIVIGPAEHRSWQAFVHQSLEWRAYFRSLRNSVERHNSEVKAGFAEALAVADRRCLRGRANNALLTAFLLVGHNLRLVRSWVDKAKSDQDGVLVQAPLKNRRGNRRPLHAMTDEQLALLDIEPLGELAPEDMPEEPPPPESPA